MRRSPWDAHHAWNPLLSSCLRSPKYLFVGMALAVLLVELCGAAESAPELALHLVSMKTDHLPDEQADFRLTFVNVGSTPVDVERALLNVGMQIQVDGEWIDCRPTLQVCPGVITEFDWRRIGPGDHLTLGAGQFGYRCLSDGSVRGPRSRDWQSIPGDYLLRSTGTHRLPSSNEIERLGSAPDGARAWSLKSNAVSVSVAEPTGVDAEALGWARDHRHHPVSVEVEHQFPTSYYAALMVGQRLTLHGGTPEQVADSIAQGSYPGRYSIPDASSPAGQRSASAGEEMARWRIEHGERLLREQPDFPREREVRLSVAVSYAALGKKDQALHLLNAIRNETGTRESHWASRFLTLQGWQ